MKRIISLALVCVLLVGVVFAFASCSKVTADYAEEINTAAKNGEPYTFGKVKEDLGKEAIDYTATILGSTNGFVVAVKGCETKEDIQAKFDAGEKVEGLLILIVNGKATSASYDVIEEDDVK